jgi:hypothetical protein
VEGCVSLLVHCAQQVELLGGAHAPEQHAERQVAGGRGGEHGLTLVGHQHSLLCHLGGQGWD